MEQLADVDGLAIHQTKEWGEILSGFETKNRYEVSDRDGGPLFYAAEEGGNPLVRVFLKAARPFTLVVVDREGKRVLTVERPFRLLFHEATVRSAQGRMLGRIVWRFSLIGRRYAVEDGSGAERFTLHGPLLKPWTFLIREGDHQRGRITKRWSGLGKEMFTDADRFGLEFPKDWPPEHKALFLGLVFFIDFRHFENRD
jgi:uncharacterized protein YxjI